MTSILDLHRRATAKGRIGYAERVERWEALHTAAAALTARLPFRWHAMGIDGRDHIVLDEAFRSGRLHRTADQALCGADTANLWVPAFGGHVTCKRCLELAKRIVEA